MTSKGETEVTRNQHGMIVVPAAPFVEVLRREHDKLLEHVPYATRARPCNEYPATGLLAAKAGVAARRMHGYLRSLNGDKHPAHTDWYRLQRVEQVLQPLGIEPWMIYPLDLIDDLDAPEPDRDCPTCSTVTPIHGSCPWCDRLLDFDLWAQWVLDRARLPNSLVHEAADFYGRRGVNMRDTAQRYAPIVGLTPGAFADALRDEFRARRIQIRGDKWPQARRQPAFAVAA